MLSASEKATGNPPDTLLQAVRRNCHIADAAHAGDYTLCTYLMKMRELYRWEHGLPLEAELDSDKVGDWVRAREAWWESLEGESFQPLPLDDMQIAPFEHDEVNAVLTPAGFVYSSGLGKHAAAHFFLAELLEKREFDEFSVLISGREWARDLVSPPAMTRGNVIFLRRESLRRLLWERVQEWRWNRCDSPLGRALEYYGLDDDLHGGLERLVDDQAEAVLLHEIGEVEVGKDIESDWQALLLAASGRKAELELRAIRDNLADAVSTLPALLEKDRPELLHFYFGTLGPMRRHLSPSLYAAYLKWHESGDLDGIASATAQARRHWRQLLDDVLGLNGNADDVSRLIEARTF